MVKMVFILRRLPNLSREEFQAYWREKHGPLAREMLPAMRCKRYVQVHTLDTPFNDLLKNIARERDRDLRWCRGAVV